MFANIRQKVSQIAFQRMCSATFAPPTDFLPACKQRLLNSDWSIKPRLKMDASENVTIGAKVAAEQPNNELKFTIKLHNNYKLSFDTLL